MFTSIVMPLRLRPHRALGDSAFNMVACCLVIESYNWVVLYCVSQ